MNESYCGRSGAMWYHKHLPLGLSIFNSFFVKNHLALGKYYHVVLHGVKRRLGKFTPPPPLPSAASSTC